MGTRFRGWVCIWADDSESGGRDVRGKLKDWRADLLRCFSPCYLQIVQLHPTGFSVEEGLVTPSLKNKREALKAKFIEEVKKMYAGGLPKM